jgi:hypothetical protein
MHQANVRDEIDKLGWGGRINKVSCESENCFSDYLSIIEANVGSNKTNYYIERSADLNISLTPERLKRTLAMKIKNSANPAIGGKGVYKNYQRLIVPENSLIDDVKVIENDTLIELTPDISIVDNNTEIGFYIEIAPQNEKTIVYSWTNNDNVDLARSGEYLLNWFKQAGVEFVPINLTFQVPQYFEFVSDPVLTLTKGYGGSYNTNLNKDSEFRLYW